MRSIAAAPSFTWLAFPAVVDPSFWKTGFSFPRLLKFVFGQIPSSTEATTSFTSSFWVYNLCGNWDDFFLEFTRCHCCCWECIWSKWKLFGCLLWFAWVRQWLTYLRWYHLTVGSPGCPSKTPLMRRWWIDSGSLRQLIHRTKPHLDLFYTHDTLILYLIALFLA